MLNTALIGTNIVCSGCKSHMHVRVEPGLLANIVVKAVISQKIIDAAREIGIGIYCPDCIKEFNKGVNRAN